MNTTKQELKLGKLPFEPHEKDIHFNKFLKKFVAMVQIAMPKVPTVTDDYKSVKAFLMYLNDQLGCCGIAGAFHMVNIWLAQAGINYDVFDDNCVINTYEKIGGYNPNDPNSDQGIILRNALIYWKTKELKDKKGKLHKIDLFSLLDVKNKDEIKLAMYLFSTIYIGFVVPQYFIDQFNQGIRYFDVQTKNIKKIGGHCVNSGGYGPYDNKQLKKTPMKVVGVTKEGVYVITWGIVVFLTWEFWFKYVDEAWVVFSEEFLKNGKSPDGYTLAQLTAFAKQF